MSKILKVARLIKRIKRRHLKLGASGILTVSRNHLRDIFGPRPKILQRLANSSHMALVDRGQTPIVDSSYRDWIVREPSLSIVLTVFNQTTEQLESSINSARIQKGAEIEIFILDDGSTREETINFLKNLKLKSNESLIWQSNCGVINARNRMINTVTTDFLVFLDPDDVFNADYISLAFEVLKLDRSIEIIYPDVLIQDVLRNSFEVWYTGPFDLETLLLVNTIPMSSIISTRLIRSLRGYSLDFETGPEDWDLWVRAALSDAKAVHLASIGYRYTKAPVSRSSTLELTQTEDSMRIKLRRIGAKAQFPFNITNQINVFLFVPWIIRIGGVEKYVKCLAEDLTNAGFNVAIITTEADPLDYEDDAPIVRNLNQIVLKRIDFPSDSLFLAALERLAAPDCIAINFGAPWAFENAVKTNSIFTKNVCFVFNTEVSLQRALNSQENFDEFWLAYESIKNLLTKEMVKKSYTIYTGTLNEQRTLGTASENRSFTVGYFGRFSLEKNPDLFLDIAAAASSTDLNFVMGGEGQLLAKIVKRGAKLENFEYLGFFSDSTEFFSLIDCLVITSDIEGIPLSAMEALNQGVVVLSKNVGGISELIRDANQGYIWDGKPKSAVELLVSLQSMKELNSKKTSLPSIFLRTNTSAKVVERVKYLID